MAERKQSKIFRFVIDYQNEDTIKKIKSFEKLLKKTFNTHKNQIFNFCYCLHNKDFFTKEDQLKQLTYEKPELVKEGQPKKIHYHILFALTMKKDLSTIESLVKEIFTDTEHKGNIDMAKENQKKGQALLNSFLNCLNYFDHYTDPSKYQYNQDKNFWTDNFYIMNNNIMKDFKKYRNTTDLKNHNELIDNDFLDLENDLLNQVLKLITYGKITPKEVFEKYPNLFFKSKNKILDIYNYYLMVVKPTTKFKANFILSGAGGTGKTFSAKYLTEQLFKTGPYFVNDLKAGFQNYTEEPAIIFNDIRATGKAGIKQNWGTGKFLDITDPHSTGAEYNKKFATTKLFNYLNLFTTPDDPADFLNSLAGSYVDENKNVIPPENPAQFYRRFKLSFIFTDLSNLEEGYKSIQILKSNLKDGFNTIKTIWFNTKDETELITFLKYFWNILIQNFNFENLTFDLSNLDKLPTKLNNDPITIKDFETLNLKS